MKKRMRLLSFMLTVVLAAATVCGCSSGGGGQTKAPDSKAETQARGDAATVAESLKETGGGESGGQEDASGGQSDNSSKKVTALFFSLEGEYFSIIDKCLKEDVTAYGYQYESQSSNSDALTMVEQIENAVAGGTDCIWIWALNGATVADALTAARAQGVKVLSFVADPGRDACDVFRGSDNVYSGECISQLAIEWADREFGADAPEGSINTILIGSTLMTEMKERTEGMESKIRTDKRFNVLEVVDTEMSTVAAQQVAENMFNKYGDIDCFITTGGELALGVISYTTAPGSPVTDHTKFGIFGTEINEEMASYMKDDIYDGSVVNGGLITNNVKVMSEIINDLLQGKTLEPIMPVDMGLLTKDQLTEYGY